MNNEDPRRLVAGSYDLIGDRYSEFARRSRSEEREKYLGVMFDLLPARARVLDVGCGNGLPMTARLAERFQVTGLDISPRQIERARRNVPSAEFMCADVTEAAFPEAGFDGIVGFYSLIHVPRELQPAVLSNFNRWLRPGGLLAAAFGPKDREEDYSNEWLGAPMFWSSFDAERNSAMAWEAGFTVMQDVLETFREEEAGWGEITFQWIVARKDVVGRG
jgi:SAM-dependent methyltransferase